MDGMVYRVEITGPLIHNDWTPFMQQHVRTIARFRVERAEREMRSVLGEILTRAP